MLPYEYARLIVQAENLGSKEQYGEFVRKHEADIPLPVDPSRQYMQWQGWSNFLGKFSSEEFASTYREILKNRLAGEGIGAYFKTKRGVE
jgi:hypothetical protein